MKTKTYCLVVHRQNDREQFFSNNIVELVKRASKTEYWECQKTIALRSLTQSTETSYFRFENQQKIGCEFFVDYETNKVVVKEFVVPNRDGMDLTPRQCYINWDIFVKKYHNDRGIVKKYTERTEKKTVIVIECKEHKVTWEYQEIESLGAYEIKKIFFDCTIITQ